MGRACWWLTPLYELVLGTVLSTDKVFADETTLPVLEPGKGRTKTGRLWCYAVDDRPWSGPTHPAAAYVYSEDRRGEHPATHLAAFRGTLQVDGYAGFGNLVDARRDASLRLAFCWVHARRPFYEFYTSNQSPLAAGISISKRQVMCLLIDSQDDFLAENREVFRAGLRTVALRANEDETWRCREFRFYLSESLTKSVQQSCCCCEGHAASRSTICWMALSAR